MRDFQLPSTASVSGKCKSQFERVAIPRVLPLIFGDLISSHSLSSSLSSKHTSPFLFFSLQMDVAWFPPTDGYVKINIHSTERQLPLQNGNVNGLGVIIRGSDGKMLWGGMGPVPNIGFLLTQLNGMHVAAMKALQLGKLKTHIETDSQWVYESIRDQDEIIFDEETEKVFRQLNTLHANHYEVGISDRKVSCTIPEMNAVAIYLAEFGMEHLSSFSEVSEPFGNLQRLLDEDMGLGAHLSLPGMQSFLGFGEVIDSLKPPSPVYNSSQTHLDVTRMSSDPRNINIDLNVNVIMESGKRFAMPHSSIFEIGQASKGKEKVLSGYKFNEDDLLSKKAIDLLDNGSLSFIDKALKKETIDLEKKVCEMFWKVQWAEIWMSFAKKIADVRISHKGVELEKEQVVGEQVDQGEEMDIEQALLGLINFNVPMHESFEFFP